ncbi:MAG: mitochondrial fission ELM1 family protein [Micavibrio aeruginosavorus]|uniref:Mitochondrial fission ELM1 family protein n=1 Tax=Micavibrio aeruginosavorus TaxID=349221 RepID=A0A7T5UGL1_9BACT|nr:MAG: mitochondrial fission ELM1 family protein [Micavibrio aeruginosavorus]
MSYKNSLVMAYIGEDTPHRGDSKAAIGLSKLVAEILNGRYIYVDADMLEKSFPGIGTLKDRLLALYAREGYPDIVIGPQEPYLPEDLSLHSPLMITGINERISERSRTRQAKKLVSHHLTRADLKREADLFRQHYPDIQGPLTGIFLADDLWEIEIIRYADKLRDIGSRYPEMTFFICPSRRSDSSPDRLKFEIEHESSFWRKIEKSGSPLESLKTAFREATHYSGKSHDKIRVMGTSWEEALSGYNPYIGLLGAADHLVVSGGSLSIVSEALFTGKNIYLMNEKYDYTALEKEGYVQDLLELSSRRKFPTREMPPLDVTREVAQSIVDEHLSRNSPVPSLAA